MPLKLNVGLSRKVGEANYGSRGASVHLELEVEAGLAADPAALRDRVRQLFQMARTSVDEELAGSNPGPPSDGNGHAAGNGNVNGNGHGSRSSNGRNATQSQVRAIHAIANRQRRNLSAELDRYGVAGPEQLSIREASELIDRIQPQSETNGGRR